MPSPQPTLGGLAAIVFASVLWGTTGTAASFAPEVSSLAIGAFAMGGGGLLLALKSRRSLRREWPRLRQHKRALLWGGLAVAIYPLAFYSAMRLSGVAIGTLISIASAPLFTVMLEWVFNRIPITRRWLLSFLFGATGIACLVVGKGESGEAMTLAASHELGVVLGLLAGLTYAAYSWIARRLIEKDLPSEPVVACFFLVAASVLLPSLLFTGGPILASLNNAAVALYMAVVPMFIGYVAFGYGLQTVPVSQVTLITLLEPVVATLLALLVLGESVSPLGWLGMGLVFFCLRLQMK